MQTELPRRWSPVSFCFLLYTELPRRWSPASFGFLLYTDRITSSLITGEFLVSSLCRQNYLAADHRRVFGIFFIQRESSRRWSSASFLYLLYTDRIASPLIIVEFFFPSLYRQNYLAADHRRVFGIFSIQTESPRRWSSARKSFCITANLVLAYYSINYILRTWRNFCRSVYWKSHIICVCVNAAPFQRNQTAKLGLHCLDQMKEWIFFAQKPSFSTVNWQEL